MAAGRSPSKCEQICQTLRRYIGSGQLAAGQQLPAERALSERFATTRITIKEALSSLEADGLIYRAERRGWFVAPPWPAASCVTGWGWIPSRRFTRSAACA